MYQKENENWSGIYLLASLAFLFLIARIGWGLGVQHERQRPPWPIGQGVYTDHTGLPTHPTPGDLYINGHGILHVYEDYAWREAEVTPVPETYDYRYQVPEQ
jgi:hypothetical protein